MSASSVINNLTQANNCAGKCDCCDKLQGQINTLKSQISALDGKYVLKSDLANFKKYIEDSFQGIRVGFEYIFKKLEREKADIQRVGFAEDRINELQNRIKDLERLLAAGMSVPGDQAEIARLGRELELLKRNAQIERERQELNRKFLEDRLAQNEAEDRKYHKQNYEGDLVKRLEAELRQEERVRASRDAAFEAEQQTVEYRIKKLEADSIGTKIALGRVELEIKAVAAATAVNTKAIAILTATVAGIAAAILVLQSQIAYLYGRTGIFGKDFTAEIEQVRSIANQANSKADNAINTAEIARMEISQLRQNFNFSIDRLRAEIKADIDFVTARALAAMQRLEALIRGEIAFLTSSTLSALLRLQRRIEQNESLIVSIQKTANDAIEKSNQAINKANEALAALAPLKAKLDQAIGKANEAINKANTAIETANASSGKSDTALSTAQDAKALGQKALDLINSFPDKLNALKAELTALINDLIDKLKKEQNDALIANAISAAIASARKDNADLENRNIYSMDRLAKELEANFQASIKAGNVALFGQVRADNIARYNEAQSKLFTLQAQAAQGNKKAAEEVSKINDQKLADIRAGISEFDKSIGKIKIEIENKPAIPQPEITAAVAKQLQPMQQKQGQFQLELDGVKTRLQVRESVDKEAIGKLNEILPKLDQIIPTIAGIPLIVGRIPDITAGKINPNIPTLPGIGTTVDKILCNNKCLPASMNQAANNAAQGIKQDLGSKIAAGNNAANTGLLLEILSRLGTKIPGGLSGKLVDGFKWLQLDRILNILTFAATVHNSAMLSNDILQTLVGALTNVLTLIVPKDEAGKSFDVSSVINSTVENAVKGIVGTENYTNLTVGWAKANRIYQATTNVLNNFMGLTQTVLQASEMIAAYTGKIGNALKKGGVVLENAYGWMNPQPKFNRVTQTLESLQNGASTIQMVTQVPLDVVNATTEFTTASTEFVKAIKEDTPANKATLIPEPDELKAKETQAKTDSQPSPFDFSDLFDGED